MSKAYITISQLNSLNSNTFCFYYNWKVISSDSSLYKFRNLPISVWSKRFFSLVPQELNYDDFVVIFDGDDEETFRLLQDVCPESFTLYWHSAKASDALVLPQELEKHFPLAGQDKEDAHSFESQESESGESDSSKDNDSTKDGTENDENNESGREKSEKIISEDFIRDVFEQLNDLNSLPKDSQLMSLQLEDTKEYVTSLFQRDSEIQAAFLCIVKRKTASDERGWRYTARIFFVDKEFRECEESTLFFGCFALEPQISINFEEGQFKLCLCRKADDVFLNEISRRIGKCLVYQVGK